MKKIAIISLFSLCVLVAHAQKQMQVNDSLLASSDMYEVTVKGREIITPYTFGDYRLINTKEDWKRIETHVLNIKERSLANEFKTIRTDFSFAFTNSVTDTAYVLALLQDKEHPLLVITSSKEYEDDVRTKDVFTAFIKTNKDTARWQMMVEEIYNTQTENTLRGYLTNGKEDFRLTVINRWNNGKKPLIGNAGVEIYKDNHAVAAVQYGGFTKAKVWLSKRLDKDSRFLLATAAETLLIRAHELYAGDNERD